MATTDPCAATDPTDPGPYGVRYGVRVWSRSCSLHDRPCGVGSGAVRRRLWLLIHNTFQMLKERYETTTLKGRHT